MAVELPDDSVRTYSDDEKRVLTSNLRAVTARVHAGAFARRRIDADLLNELHYELFKTVRGHAGRSRSTGFGSESLSFGPISSAPRNEVPKLIKVLVEDAQRGCDEAGSATGPARAERALRHAAIIHARFIRIHPYEDGNGRVGRLLMNVILVRLGFLPIAVEVAKQEYYEVINVFHRTGDSGPLFDLLLRLTTSAL